jgi:hypothetical protein
MNRLTFLFLIGLTITIAAQGQMQIVIPKADSLRNEGDLKGALVEFKKMYLANPRNKTTIYNYACALSLDGQNDSSFKYLNLRILRDTSSSALTDPDFLPLRQDERWNEFENKLISMLQIQCKNCFKDLDYCKALWKMKALDQAYYSEINIAEKKIGKSTTVVSALWELKNRINNQNQKELETLIEKKGWPKISQVGNNAANAAFLVIQHSDNDKQKKYLPTIKKLCEEKEASWQNYALMYDRIQIGDHKPQKYGSQVNFNQATNKWELSPLEDETKVDEWRKEVGLEPLADYVANWGIKFAPQKK